MPGEASRQNGKKGGRPKGAISRHGKRLAGEVAALIRAELDAEAVKEQIRRGGWFDIRRLFDEHGNFRPLHELTFDEAFAIAGVEVLKRNVTTGDNKTDEVLKIRLIDRSKYIEMAADRLWPAPRAVEMTLTVTEERLERLREGRARMAAGKLLDAKTDG